MEIEITYIPENNHEEKIRIFGRFFVNKNYDKCEIIYNSKKYQLKEYLEEIDNQKYYYIDKIQLKLRIFGRIFDFSYLFCNCYTLLSFRIIPQLNDYKFVDNNYENMENNPSFLFEDSKFLNPSEVNNTIINDIDNLNISPIISSIKINNITYDGSTTELFQNNYIIPSLINSNVTNMDSIFYNCFSLISLPDISNWDTSNVTSMGSLFYNCNSLISLTDISNWNTSNVTSMECMFYNCISLVSLPDISKWDTSNVIDMGSMFCCCLSLVLMPDISRWNTLNAKKIYYMFLGCNSLISIPDISKWNVSNANFINSMFSECLSLISTPDISKWNIKKKNILKTMFEGNFNCLNNLS